MILPRQARDKHRDNSKETVFSKGNAHPLHAEVHNLSAFRCGQLFIGLAGFLYVEGDGYPEGGMPSDGVIESQMVWSRDGAVWHHADEVAKRAFCAIYTLKSSFYQDRLGTNIGKTQKKPVFSKARTPAIPRTPGAKNASLSRQFILNMIILVRQARDEHRECTQKRDAFFAGNFDHGMIIGTVRQGNVLFAMPFCTV